MKLHIWFALIFAAMLSPSAFGATFSASVAICTGASDTQVNAEAVAELRNDFCSGTGGSAAAVANGSGLGVAASYYHTCCQTYGSAVATADVMTEFIIYGQGQAPILVSLNLTLNGGFNGGVTEDYNSRFLEMRLNTPGGVFLGRMLEISNPPGGLEHSTSGQLAPPGTNCYLTCNITSPEFYVTPNTMLALRINLMGVVTSSTGTSYGAVSALDTLYFPLNGPVFNLPDGYTATIFGMNVEGNRVVGQDTGGGEVPEPATWISFGAGLALLGLLRRRRIS